ncbi:regulator [Pandoraea terrae]|uniref:Regulator n=1 Tax=Pandoraea terrae TaxID=1537710 RepID=A0A5E4VPR3_9BURK|nr:regulator [Pandoraea terrae]VVE14211.1 regulator [Pandoraea terrae]
MDTPALHFLLPFALPASAHIPALLGDLELPALEKLLARATLTADDVPADPFVPTLPHERWLATTFGLPGVPARAPLAPFMLLADGGTLDGRYWYCVQPAHIHIATDHLVLTDPAELALDPADADTLFQTARALFAEDGAELIAPRPDRWYLSAPMLGELLSASPARAAGRNVDIWLPKGPAELTWRKLQNEVQMAWHAHPANDAREARGLPPVNALWLYAGGQRIAAPRLNRPFVTVIADDPATRGLSAHVAIDAHATAAGLGAAQGMTLVQLDALGPYFVAEDWARWRDAWVRIDTQWLAPALQRLAKGETRDVALTLCGDSHGVTMRVRSGDLRKFWRRQSLTDRLVPLAKLGEDAP